jgi:hypothetical protein
LLLLLLLLIDYDYVRWTWWGKSRAVIAFLSTT